MSQDFHNNRPYEGITSRLDACETVADLQSYAEWLYESDLLDESEQTHLFGERGPMAPWDVPASAEVLDDNGEDTTIRLRSGECARWENTRRAWRAVTDPADALRGLTFQVPPECQGQIVEVAYACDAEDSRIVKRVTDRSDRSVRSDRSDRSDRSVRYYEVSLEALAEEVAFEPWNTSPEIPDDLWVRVA